MRQLKRENGRLRDALPLFKYHGNPNRLDGIGPHGTVHAFYLWGPMLVGDNDRMSWAIQRRRYERPGIWCPKISGPLQTSYLSKSRRTFTATESTTLHSHTDILHLIIWEVFRNISGLVSTLGEQTREQASLLQNKMLTNDLEMPSFLTLHKQVHLERESWLIIKLPQQAQMSRMALRPL